MQLKRNIRILIRSKAKNVSNKNKKLMKSSRPLFTVLFLGLIMTGCKQTAKPEVEALVVSTPNAKLIAKVYNSGFKYAHDSFNALSSASDGKIYYVLSTVFMDIAAQMYSFDPKTGTIEHLGDLSEICGEKNLKVVAQGKSHVNFIESNGKLYFATHLGYYSIIGGKEKPGIPNKGYNAYRGGHILAFDMKNKTFEDLGIAQPNEGILTMNMDTDRGLIYSLTWPTGYLVRYDVAKKEMKNLGPITGKGEGGMGTDFRAVCRSIAINPENGTIYLTTADGQIKSLKAGQDVVETIEGVDMKKDYFGKYEVSTPGTYAYNWRQTFWYAPEKTIYGVHGKSSYLFRFDPSIPRIEVLERLTSIPSKLSGMFDQLPYGYLGFKLSPDNQTIYYLTGAPIYINGKRVLADSTTSVFETSGLEDLHLITYDIPTGKYLDHGAVFYPDNQRPTYVNSIAIGDDGTIYSLARITENGRTRTDLISFQVH